MLGRGGRWLQRAWGAASGPPQPAPRGAQLSFDGAVFRLKSGWELVRGLLVFRLCALPGLVRRAPTLLSVSRRLLGHRLWGSLLRASFYGQFVAGQTPPEVGVTVQRLHALGLRPLLAVPIEEDVGQDKEGGRCRCSWRSRGEVGAEHGQACGRDGWRGGELLRPEPRREPAPPGLPAAAGRGHPAGGGGGCAGAGGCRVHLREPRADACHPGSDGALESHPALGVEHLPVLPAGLPGAARCGRGAGRASGLLFRVKLVRGAYLEQERWLARERGYPDPLHPTWEATNHSYERCLDLLLELVARDGQRCQLIVASHNEASVSHTVRRMEELGIAKDGGAVCFGQLLGMCDHVSLALGQAGYAIYKSIPYGAVEDVLPYLVRRAQENQSVLQGTRKERDLLRQELWRRLQRRP
ncbi:unnamed protein product [Lepidochelys kempii]